jgi:hypothetical protein
MPRFISGFWPPLYLSEDNFKYPVFYHQPMLLYCE